MRPRHLTQFPFGFGEGDIKHRLFMGSPVAEKLNAESGLARSRIAIKQIEMARRQAAIDDLVQTGRACRNSSSGRSAG